MMIKAYHVLNPLALFISLRQTLQSELVKTTVVGFSNLKIGSLISNFNFCSPAHFKRAKAYQLWYRMSASWRCSNNRSLSHKSPGILPNFDHSQVHWQLHHRQLCSRLLLAFCFLQCPTSQPVLSEVSAFLALLIHQSQSLSSFSVCWFLERHFKIA